MARYHAAVIGGGPAGICAAISQARQGHSVIICEKMPRLGKKLLASGNGRCNLLNDDLSEAYYNPAGRELVKSVFSQFGKDRILEFLRGLGLETYSNEGRLFPVTNQAASVLKVLEIELKRLSVPVEMDFNCSDIALSADGYVVTARTGKQIECAKVIITGGGKSYPALGSDGSLYTIAARLGHTIIEPVPSAVPLVVKDRLCHLLQGQRILATAKSIIEGKTVTASRGELLFTKYGLSGTCIIDVSEEISIALNRQHQTDVLVSVDMLPLINIEELTRELERRKKEKWPADEMLVGLLPNKLSAAIQDLFGKNDIGAATAALKDWRFRVIGTRGWNEAEFTSGGINISEVNISTLESKIKKGVYFAGEVLDVNGKRGGYNLGWAWASGVVAGQAK